MIVNVNQTKNTTLSFLECYSSLKQILEWQLLEAAVYYGTHGLSSFKNKLKFGTKVEDKKEDDLATAMVKDQSISGCSEYY